MKRTLLISLLAAVSCAAAEPSSPPLTLDDALVLAVKNSKAAQLARLRVDEASAATDTASRLRYPQVSITGIGVYLQRPTDIKISQGSLTPALNEVGVQLGLTQMTSAVGQFPTTDITLAKGSYAPVLGSLTIAQPLSQLWRINSGVRAAKAGLTESQREATRILSELRFSIEQLFVGILIENKRVLENEARLAAQERKLRDAENARTVGELLDEAVLGMRASVLQTKTELTRSRQQREKLSLQLADLVGRPGDAQLALVGEPPAREEDSLDRWIAEAKNNPDRQIAAAVVEKASSGVRAARQAHIPELSLIASGYAQDGIPLVARRSAAVGLSLSWDVFDFGRKDAEVARAVAQRRSAEVNRDRIEEDATRQIRLAYQDLNYAKEVVALAKQALAYRQRAAQLSQQSAANGLALETAALEAEAELRKAEADLTTARYQQHLALLRLHFLAGKL